MEAKKTTTQEGDQEAPLQSTSQGAQGQMTNPYGYGFPFGMPYQYPQPSVETIPKLSMAERKEEEGNSKKKLHNSMQPHARIITGD